ncbi:MAG: tRNA preQ1(34) S-adenosylmethionine ribosyltransferase-isomerase QueA [Anaerolineae bacterium]|nr:tRNA preQ1(34) S-adenosylmethionine ribosyltransferase-isomerase QueA [Anaerolineae bacterium]
MTEHLHDYDYDLPPEFIAQTAVEPRDASKLLVVHRQTKAFEHRIFRDLTDYLRPGDMLVLNQTRVIPARLHARKTTGGAAEILLLQPLSPTRWLCMIGASRIRQGSVLTLEGAGIHLTATVLELRDETKRVVEFSEPIEPHLDKIGEMPLPPYIHEKLTDPERYQTVYARKSGSVAAPTAGLHFTGDLLVKIQAMGVQIAYCTLHVGPGTFQPVRAEQIAAHKLHEEYAELLPEEAKRINEAKLRRGRIIAVGTTTVRTLETAAIRSAGEAGEDVCPWRPVIAINEPTSLFIMPGFKFRVVDMMVTNFHLPKSTLLMLVSAFAGRDLMLEAYEIAKQEHYRFYSLGDACLLTN